MSSTEVTLAMNTGDLLNMLGNVVTFTHKTDEIAVLNALNLEVKDGHVTAYGTDRYRLARVKMPVTHTEGDWSGLRNALMSRSVVDQFVKVLKGEKHAIKSGLTAHLVGTVSNGGVSEWRLLAGNSQSSASQLFLDGVDYPKIKTLFPGMQAPEPCGLMSFNAAFLADMAKVKDLTVTRDREPMRIVGNTSSSKPVSFFRYSWFEGLLMPVRLDDQSAYGNFNLAA